METDKEEFLRKIVELGRKSIQNTGRSKFLLTHKEMEEFLKYDVRVVFSKNRRIFVVNYENIEFVHRCDSSCSRPQGSESEFVE